MEDIAQEFAARIGAKLPNLILQLLRSGIDINDARLQLDCSLSIKATSGGRPVSQLRVASLDIDEALRPASQPADHFALSPAFTSLEIESPASTRSDRFRTGLASPTATNSPHGSVSRPVKRRKANPNEVRSEPTRLRAGGSPVVQSPERELEVVPQRKKRLPDNPALQPSTLEKFINGIWETLHSGMKLDPTGVVQQWLSVDTNGAPRLLMNVEQEFALARGVQGPSMRGIFGRISVLTRKISESSRASRCLEVIVQAHWVQCFDERVTELAENMPRDKAKKSAIAEACVDLDWSEKELRNKMGVWRGYHEIQEAGGWAALEFAGSGLYRFCKYRASLNGDASKALRSLRHRFEVAADTLHPGWRDLLGIIGVSTKPKYHGHPHDWVVGDPSGEAIPLPQTYQHYDPDFAYTHLERSTFNERVWGGFDPRTVEVARLDGHFVCQSCNERQSDDPILNSCSCFPTLYGGTKSGATPVQVYRTPTGKNNGLLACCSFDCETAVGEFVGQITSGLANLDVMIGQTDQASYQIWQGRQGNFTRFINHSCQPNSQFERFVWCGTQRIVLVSLGIQSGEEITVDYSHTYWKDLDKECLCGEDKCRYANRGRQQGRQERQLLTPPESG